MSYSKPLSSAASHINAPLVYSGKVRELYDLGEHFLIIVTDRISAYDYILQPSVPGKGNVLNQMSLHWFQLTEPIIGNHIVHSEAEMAGNSIKNIEEIRDRMMVVKKTNRIAIECVVRGYLTGDGWRQYQETSQINGNPLPPGMHKNEKLKNPIFTPAKKNDSEHDENITFEELASFTTNELARQLEQISISLYNWAADYCKQYGIILADAKFEFGQSSGQLLLIDEIFTPDCSRFWPQEHYRLDAEIESLDKEPIRQYLKNSEWDLQSPPPELPVDVVEATSQRYQAIAKRLFPGY